MTILLCFPRPGTCSSLMTPPSSHCSHTLLKPWKASPPSGPSGTSLTPGWGCVGVGPDSGYKIQFSGLHFRKPRIRISQNDVHIYQRGRARWVPLHDPEKKTSALQPSPKAECEKKQGWDKSSNIHSRKALPSCGPAVRLSVMEDPL